MTIALDCPPGSVVRLAVGLRGCKVVVLDYDHRSSRFVSGFNVQLDNIVPRCVAFTNTTTRDIYVLGMYGQMYDSIVTRLAIRLPTFSSG